MFSKCYLSIYAKKSQKGGMSFNVNGKFEIQMAAPSSTTVSATL